MTDLLAHLNRDTLPEALVDAFIQWCIWEQARPALITVLEVGMMHDLADNLRHAETLVALMEHGDLANAYAKQMQGQANPKMLSAAEAAAFEFGNMMRATTPDHYDAEEVAFFASRVCGWAQWAISGFADPNEKMQAEDDARKEQETHLERLWREAASNA